MKCSFLNTYEHAQLIVIALNYSYHVYSEFLAMRPNNSFYNLILCLCKPPKYLSSFHTNIEAFKQALKSSQYRMFLEITLRDDM